jgi:hypothetical protein
MRLLTAVITLCLSVSLSTSLPGVPEVVQARGWRITLNTPPIKDRLVQQDDSTFSYHANSGRLNVAIFAETRDQQGGHQQCYELYWPQTGANPLIRKQSIKASHTETYHRVEYLVATTIHGEPVTQQNVNYYFVFEGKWVQVHLSVVNPTPEDAAIITAFDEGLVYSKK